MGVWLGFSPNMDFTCHEDIRDSLFSLSGGCLYIYIFLLLLVPHVHNLNAVRSITCLYIGNRHCIWWLGGYFPDEPADATVFSEALQMSAMSVLV